MISQALEQYAEAHTSPESAILQRIHRQTFLNTPYPNMLSGTVQGSLLRMISHMLRPARILEIGAFTGYSAICLAEGLSDDGLLYTIEINPEMEEMLRSTFRDSGMKEKIILHMGDALEIIPGLDETFDLVFIDADKEHYCRYYEAALAKTARGGFLLADNVFWGGKVIDENASSDKETQGIRRFNAMVNSDPRVETLCLTIRDGLMLIRKH